MTTDDPAGGPRPTTTYQLPDGSILTITRPGTDEEATLNDMPLDVDEAHAIISRYRWIDTTSIDTYGSTYVAGEPTPPHELNPQTVWLVFDTYGVGDRYRAIHATEDGARQAGAALCYMGRARRLNHGQDFDHNCTIEQCEGHWWQIKQATVEP